MISIEALRALFRVPVGNPELMQSQLKAYSRQVPLLYFLVVVNTASVAVVTHFGVAPNALTIGFPALVAVMCVARVWTWMKRQDEIPSDAEAASRLRTAVVLGGLLGFILFCWGISLYPYGDAYAQSHVVFYLGFTVVSCIFCLMHLRPAALLLTGAVIVPFTIFFVLTGRPVFIAMALNMLLVSVAMVHILLIYSRDFTNLIDFQKELVAQHRETKRLSDENLRLANLDSLTDLPNRRQFFAKLHELLNRRRRRHKKRFVVGLIDLDGFKSVNDLYGHVTGDRLLVESGRRMQSLCGDAVFLARLGGDEFGVIVEADMGETDIQAFGSRICDVLEAPFTLPGIIAQVSGSVGFATFPEAGVVAEQLFERADYALYHAKQNLRGRAVIFSAEHEIEIRQFSRLEQCLRQCDLESEMSLHFQPIFDVERGEAIAFEALARWDSRKLGRVPPAVFVRVAERSDLISKLTRTLLRKTLDCASVWPREIGISFNLSVRDLTSYEAIVNIVAIIENSGVAPGRIDLEVTETALIKDFEQASASLQTLKALGVGYFARRFRHRLFEPELRPPLPHRQDQDRPQLRQGRGDGAVMPRHRQIGDRPVPEPEPHLHCRGHGDR